VTRAASQLAAVTSTARDAISGSAGIAVTFCRLSWSIRQNVPCAVETLVIEGLLGLCLGSMISIVWSVRCLCLVSS
jgi:hypothetical protein